MPLPNLIVVLMVGSAVVLVALWLSQQTPHAQAEREFQQRLGIPYRRIYGHVFLWGLVGFTGLLLFLLGHRPVEDLMWKSGNFGEAPNNRSVNLHGVDGGALIEFSVWQHPVDGLYVGFPIPDSYELTETKLWLDSPDQKLLPDLARFNNSLTRGAELREVDGWLTLRLERSGVEPSLSVYLFTPGLAAWPFRACFFRSNTEVLGHVCGDGVQRIDHR